MSNDHRTEPATQPEPAEGADLEYDLAHEAGTAEGGSVPVADKRAEPTYVPTETQDYDGDYSYDLAHDVPKARPR